MSVVPLLREAHPERPALDMAIAHALLLAAARDGRGAVRLFRPGPTVAFGRLDRLRPGFAAAVAAARRHGYVPVLRSSGGHAVAYDQRSLVLEHVTAEADSTAGLPERFRAGSASLASALETLGLRPRVGELPGEYCAGAYSVSLDGVKVAGTSQRVIRGAALFGAVVLVGGGAGIRAVLTDVYAALGLDWEPATAGAIDDIDPTVTLGAVDEALVATLASGRRIAEQKLAGDVLDSARALEHQHRLDRPETIRR